MTRNWGWVMLFFLPLAGCNGSSQTSADATPLTPVGVVDLDRAASELGLAQQVADILKAEDQQLVAGLMDIKRQLQQQFDAKKKEAGDTPSSKHKEELQLMELQANQILENIRMRSQARLQEVKASLIQQVRLKFSETIQSVAKARQMNVVLTSPNDAVIYSMASVDVTGELIEAVRASGSTIKLEPPAPPAKAPTNTGSVPATPGSSTQKKTPARERKDETRGKTKGEGK